VVGILGSGQFPNSRLQVQAIPQSVSKSAATGSEPDGALVAVACTDGLGVFLSPTKRLARYGYHLL